MPPIDFGVTWRPVGTHKRYGDALELWLCDEAPQLFQDAYRSIRGALTGAGYSWTDRGHDGPGMKACWWDMDVSVDVAALQAEVDGVVAEAAATREEKARAAAERLAAEVAEVAPRAALIRVQLSLLNKARPWAFGRQLTEARDLLDVENWNRGGFQYADRLLSNARGNVVRAAERLGQTPPAKWFARANDERIRAAALEACQFLSALDADWASERNGRGWSQATSWTGHLLSEREVLDQGEAAHALSILYGHRKQLPYRLAHTLFYRGLQCPERYPAPEDAALLL